MVRGLQGSGPKDRRPFGVFPQSLAGGTQDAHHFMCMARVARKLVVLLLALGSTAAAELSAHAKPSQKNEVQGKGRLDPSLQTLAQKLLRQARPQSGGIIVANPHSGQILAWAEKSTRRDKSWLTHAKAPSASLFKLVTTAALLEKGGVPPNRKVCTSGGVRLIQRKHLDPPRTKQPICSPFRHALGHSKNAVYAQLATSALTRRDLIETGAAFGFNQPLRFERPAEMGRLDVPYGDLAFARAAAGFSHSTLSTLGALQLATVIANGGRRPHFFINPPKGKFASRQVIEPRTARRLARMMEVTIHSGTCRTTFSDERGQNVLGTLKAAGKTGTLRRRPHGPTTSWFVGFAPSRKPRIVISILLNNGEIWHRQAKEVGRDLLVAYFKPYAERPGLKPKRKTKIR